jgi:hypothetical protein
LKLKAQDIFKMKNKFIFLLMSFSFLCKAQIDENTIKASVKREDTCTIKIKRLAINSEYSDFSPYILNNNLLFVSGRYNSLGIVYTGVHHEATDIYTATRIDSIRFKKVKELEGAVNTRFNEGPFTMNENGTIIYFTGNDKSNALKIFQSKKTNNKWSAPEAVPFCADDYSYCHPTLSPDGKVLYFASNKPGGFGGMDLYYSRLGPKGWRTPVNMGPRINSSADEVFPFIAAKKQFYFSSNTKNGIGGLDIFSINLVDTAKGIVKHFGPPFNSKADDFGVWIDSTLTQGYFSTNRIAKNKDDIYMFYAWIPDFSDSKKPVVKNTFCYTFFEETTLGDNDTNSLVHEWDFGDGSKTRNIKARHCYDKPGDYLVQLNIIQKVSGEIFRSEASYSLTVDPPLQLVINCRDTVLSGKDAIITAEKSALKDYEIDKTYWSFGDGKYNDGPFVKHNYKKPGTYTLQMWVLAKHQKTAQLEKFRTEKKIVVTDKTTYAKK